MDVLGKGGLIYGIILLILGIAGLYNKANLCSYYIAGFLSVLGLLAIIVIIYFEKMKK
jgi:hypothetical protein